jgi:GAF domain-containing protein
LLDGIPIGAILIRRTKVQSFAENDIELLKAFADQAVIAIENVRLFQENRFPRGSVERHRRRGDLRI